MIQHTSLTGWKLPRDSAQVVQLVSEPCICQFLLFQANLSPSVLQVEHSTDPAMILGQKDGLITGRTFPSKQNPQTREPSR